MITEYLLHVIDVIDLLTELVPFLFGVSNKLLLFVEAVTKVLPCLFEFEEQGYLLSGKSGDSLGKFLLFLTCLLHLLLTFLLYLFSLLASLGKGI